MCKLGSWALLVWGGVDPDQKTGSLEWGGGLTIP